MKLKNKRTGEIATLIVDGAYKFVTNFAVEDDEGNRLGEYDSLAELNEEWEDYKEPKEYWYIDIDGGIMLDNVEDDTVKVMREIGNYFYTREEAEQAVEKLKAAKRLKDKGFRFDNFVRNAIYYKLSDEEIEKDDALEDLDLLFGGEE